ncbi:MAG: hypothetical protein ACOCSA_02640 [Candidatus Hadarchaeota archaeon]
MKRGIKSFARSIRDGDVERSEELLDKVVQGRLSASEWGGYRMALKGMIGSFSSNNEMTLAQQIYEGKFGRHKVENFFEVFSLKASQSFRPEKEIGFNLAWSQVLEVILKDIKEE